MKRIIFLVAIVTMLASCNPYGSQSIVNNLTKDDYKRYFEDKIQTKSNN